MSHYLTFYVLITGGDKRTRTADICRAKAALYQLSYIPFPKIKCFGKIVDSTSPQNFGFGDVGYAGFEPATSPLSGVRSNQLS